MQHSSRARRRCDPTPVLRTGLARSVLEDAAERVRAAERHDLLVVKTHAVEDGAKVVARARVLALRERRARRRQPCRVAAVLFLRVNAAILHVDLGAASNLRMRKIRLRVDKNTRAPIHSMRSN